MTDATSHQHAMKLFYSYAPADESLRKELEEHLALLQRQGYISGWHHGSIGAGSDWQEETTAQLNTAQIILLLVSASFMASDFCYGTEMTRALQRHAAGEARLIPILLRPCDWQQAPFSHLQPLPANTTPITKWPDRDEAFLDVATGIRKVIQELAVSQPPTTPDPSTPIFHIPFARNPFFTGREEVLTHLHTMLYKDKTAAITQSQVQAISGLGGIGKTQTAVEYAYRHQDDYQYVFWVKSETSEEIISDFLTIAALLNLPQRNVADQKLIVGAVKRWLEEHRGWLVIFDNADNLKMVRDYLPSGSKGHILLTTRAQAMGQLAHKVEIEKMEGDEGALFLLRRANLIGHDEKLDQAKAADVAKAKEIVQAVDGLPLALDQAGAYIEETACSLTHYLGLYQKQQARLLKRRGTTVSEHDHPQPVANTWEISFHNVEKANPAAADLLRLCAFLAPDDLPEEIITEGADELGPTLEAVAKDPFELDAAIEELRKYSLVKRDRDAQTLTIHRLVQAVLKDEMDEEVQRQWAERAVRAVRSAFPYVEYKTWPQCKRLLPHAQVCAELIRQWNMEFEEAAWLLNGTGSYVKQRALYTEAGLLYQQALMIYEKVLGSEHSYVATILNNLALLYKVQGKYEQAEPLYQRALAIWEKVLEPEHPDVALSLNNLALLYQDQGKYEQAEPLLQRVLAIREKVLEPEHPDVARSLNNLAGLYRAQGKYEQAEPLLQRALAIREKVLEPEHPDVATSLNNLALLYATQGKYVDAEPLYQRALAIRQKVLEPEHPDLATSFLNLGWFYYQQGKYEQAEPFLQQALAIREKALGPVHPDVALTLEHYAYLLRLTHWEDEATKLQERAREIRERHAREDGGER